MLVRATEACFIGGQRIRVNARFDYQLKEGEVLPPHLVPVNAGEPAAQADAAQKPLALSEMAMNESKPKSFVESVNKRK